MSDVRIRERLGTDAAADALRAVLDLHEPEAFSIPETICLGCTCEGLYTAYPCNTVRAIARALEVNIDAD